MSMSTPTINKKAFQSNANCQLGDRRMNYILKKFENVRVGAGSLYGEGQGRAIPRIFPQTERLTDMTEDITFLQLHWWAVTTHGFYRG